MDITYIITGLILLVSLIFDREKTGRAIVVAGQKFLNILPTLLTMLILVSIALYLVPDKVIAETLGNNGKLTGMFFASIFGSITILPGFIAFPLAGILLREGVTYTVLSAFTMTLMLVGVVTFPIEKQYLGVKVAVIRNLIGLLIALVVAVITGICFGEIL